MSQSDMFYMLRTGDDKAGIVFNGLFVSDPYPGDEWAIGHSGVKLSEEETEKIVELLDDD